VQVIILWLCKVPDYRPPQRHVGRSIGVSAGTASPPFEEISKYTLNGLEQKQAALLDVSLGRVFICVETAEKRVTNVVDHPPATDEQQAYKHTEYIESFLAGTSGRDPKTFVAILVGTRQQTRRFWGRARPAPASNGFTPVLVIQTTHLYPHWLTTLALHGRCSYGLGQ
jgi:hypothetical protein